MVVGSVNLSSVLPSRTVLSGSSAERAMRVSHESVVGVRTSVTRVSINDKHSKDGTQKRDEH